MDGELTLADLIEMTLRGIRMSIDMPCIVCPSGRMYANEDENAECVLCGAILERNN